MYVPSGSPPPFGDKFPQKMEWLMCPPPLNLIADCKPMTPLTLPVEIKSCDQAAMSRDHPRVTILLS